MKLTIIILSAIFLASNAWGCAKTASFPGPRKKNSSAEEKEKTAAPAEENLDLAQQIIQPQSFKVDLSRDPFEPLEGMPAAAVYSETSSATISSLKVIGILCKKEGSIALLESSGETQMLKEGEKIGQYVVAKIEPTKVTMEENGKKFTLELGEKE